MCSVIPKFSAASGVGGGDDVPSGASAADVIERGEAARHMVGRIECGRSGRDETDALGCARQRREQRERLERRDRMTALERIHRHVQHRHVVGHEESVELRPLQRLSEALDMSEIKIRVRIGARIAPRAGVDAGRPHEGVEMDLAGGGHRDLVGHIIANECERPV
jgi:hypothetical protein